MARALIERAKHDGAHQARNKEQEALKAAKKEKMAAYRNKIADEKRKAHQTVHW